MRLLGSGETASGCKAGVGILKWDMKVQEMGLPEVVGSPKLCLRMKNSQKSLEKSHLGA